MPIALETTSLTESLINALRSLIISGEIAPGMRLSTQAVAEKFGVAQITARAGIDRLVAEGILRRGHRKSAVVPKLTAVDVSDIYLSRGPIEELAVKLLATSQQVPADAEAALERMHRAGDGARHHEHTEADIALHRALINATGSERLRRMHEAVMGEAQLCIAQVRRHEGLDLGALTGRHADILGAIGNGDPDAAARALHADLDRCRETLLADLAAAAPDGADPDDNDRA